MKRWLRWVIGICLIGSGIFFLTSSVWKDVIADSTSEYVIEHMELQDEDEFNPSYDFKSVTPLSLKDVLQARNRFHHLPTIGVISIPDVSLKLPIIKGLDDESLAVGAGTMHPDQQMGKGNYALAGHYLQHSTALFGPLHEIEIGATIYLQDDMRTYEYVVTSLETVSPERVDVLDDTSTPTITLITCTFDTTERLIVKGELVTTSS
ncbi:MULTISPECIES: class A sortase [unclassified Exiguobacterium]|uniref:class A sortase n=1 Tax=unclassified Exiguobacterium TaxID=2644629 RepID=UPI001BEC0DA6|nr:MULTISPECIES: class A sortase [unclassified Exiguobacterium]